MTSSEFKKVARLLRDAYKELEAEAINNGIDLFSPEYKELQDSVRLAVLEKSGFTLEEYRTIKEEVAGVSTTSVLDFVKKTKVQIDELKGRHIPTADEIAQIAESIAEKYIKPPQIINQIVKEKTIEKPIEKTITKNNYVIEKYNAKPLEDKIVSLAKKVDGIKLPEPIDPTPIVESYFKDNFSVNFKYNIDTYGMPDFRKLAWGLQDQIDSLKRDDLADVNSISNSDGYLTISPTTGNVIANLAGTVGVNTGGYIKDKDGNYLTALNADNANYAQYSTNGYNSGRVLAVNNGGYVYDDLGNPLNSVYADNSGTVNSISGNDHNSLANLTTGDVHTQYALLAGRSGGQTLIGGTASGNNLTLKSTSHATKGKIIFGNAGTTVFDEVNNRIGIGTASPDAILTTYATSNADRTVNARFHNAGSGYATASSIAFSFSNLNNDDAWISAPFGSVSNSTDLVFGTGGDAGSTMGTEKMRILGTGNVGIGAVAPTNKLEVGGGTGTVFTAINGASSGTAGGAAIRFQNGGTDVGVFGNQSAVYGSAYSNNFAFYTSHNLDFNAANLSFTTTGTVDMSSFHITAAGKAGIGSAVPQGLLEVYSASNISTTPMISLRSDLHSVGNFAMIRFGDYTQTTDYQKGALIMEGTSGSAQMKFHIALENTATSASVALTDAKFTVLPNGNVGVGTVNPAYKTVVKDVANTNWNGVAGGTMVISQGSNAIGCGSALLFNVNETDSLARISSYAQNTSVGDLVFETNNGSNPAERMRILAAGNVGINTGVTVSAKLHVISTSSLIRAGYDTSNYFNADVSSTGAVTFDAVGSGASFTFSDRIINSTAGAASAPAEYLTGAWLTGGTGTTNFPHLFLQATGTTAATTWSTAGTALGINAVTGFTGNFLDFRVAGASAGFAVSYLGDIALSGSRRIQATNLYLQNGSGAIVLDAAMQANYKFTHYSGVAVAGWGVPAIYKAGRATAQTAANTSVSTYTCGAADGSFEVSANVLVTTSSAENFTVTVDYTDEGNTARTLTLNFQTIAGVIGTAVNFANGAVPYEGIPVHLRVKASTAITVKTTGTFTGATYNVEGIIKQMA